MKNLEEYKLEIAHKYGYESWYLLHLSVGSRIFWYYERLIEQLLNEKNKV